jgi:hypothetical protein
MSLSAQSVPPLPPSRFLNASMPGPKMSMFDFIRLAGFAFQL